MCNFLTNYFFSFLSAARIRFNGVYELWLMELTRWACAMPQGVKMSVCMCLNCSVPLPVPPQKLNNKPSKWNETKLEKWRRNEIDNERRRLLNRQVNVVGVYRGRHIHSHFISRTSSTKELGIAEPIKMCSAEQWQWHWPYRIRCCFHLHISNEPSCLIITTPSLVCYSMPFAVCINSKLAIKTKKNVIKLPSLITFIRHYELKQSKQ